MTQENRRDKLDDDLARKWLAKHAQSEGSKERNRNCGGRSDGKFAENSRNRTGGRS